VLSQKLCLDRQTRDLGQERNAGEARRTSEVSEDQVPVPNRMVARQYATESTSAAVVDLVDADPTPKRSNGQMTLPDQVVAIAPRRDGPEPPCLGELRPPSDLAATRYH